MTGHQQRTREREREMVRICKSIILRKNGSSRKRESDMDSLLLPTLRARPTAAPPLNFLRCNPHHASFIDIYMRGNLAVYIAVVYSKNMRIVQSQVAISIIFLISA